jgi:arginine exporter protein ArgO
MLSILLNKTNWLLLVVGLVAVLFVLAFAMLVLDPDAVNRLQQHSAQRQAADRADRLKQQEKRH